MGLSGHELFRADEPSWKSGRTAPLHRQVSSGRHRRDHGLGAGPFSKRRARASRVRRDRSLRTHGPAPGRASGLGHAHFQLWPQRSAQFPDRERALLAGQISHRRAAGGCGRVHALSRLFAQRRAVDPECFRRPRESGRGLFSETLQRSLLRAFSGNCHDRRGINRLARRFATDVSRRTRVRVQMEHGLDARLS